METKYFFERYEIKRRLQVVALLSEWHADEDEKVVDDYFRWKYDENPISKRPIAFVALQNDKVVGFRGFFPIRFQYKGKEIGVLVPADAYVTPEHRRNKILSRTTKYAEDELAKEGEYRFFLTVSSNANSSAAYQKMGWQKIGERYSYERFQIGACLRYLRKRPSWKFSALAIVEAEKISELYSLLSNEMSSYCTPCYSLETMKWRFQNPRRRYLAAPYYRNGRLQAFAVGCYEARMFMLLDYRESSDADENSFYETMKALWKNVSIPSLCVEKNGLTLSQLKTLRKMGFRPIMRFVNQLRKRPMSLPTFIHAIREEDERSVSFLNELSQGERWLIPGWCNDGL